MRLEPMCPAMEQAEVIHVQEHVGQIPSKSADSSARVLADNHWGGNGGLCASLRKTRVGLARRPTADHGVRRDSSNRSAGECPTGARSWVAGRISHWILRQCS